MAAQIVQVGRGQMSLPQAVEVYSKVAFQRYRCIDAWLRNVYMTYIIESVLVAAEQQSCLRYFTMSDMGGGCYNDSSFQ